VVGDKTVWGILAQNIEMESLKNLILIRKLWRMTFAIERKELRYTESFYLRCSSQLSANT
jgi:hypothetical protein